ncbi:Uncharacterised protein [Mycobacteroides abscessus subsp. abscessus]|nr:Uncharacterised protein [Mycobacteroides abscessus subsp. abscessus]
MQRHSFCEISTCPFVRISWQVFQLMIELAVLLVQEHSYEGLQTGRAQHSGHHEGK